MQILVPEKYWYTDPLIINIGYGETKTYYLLKYPYSDFPDYVAKIPADYVVLKNKKPSIVEVWDEFVFTFEKKGKLAGKRFKKINLSAVETAKLYEEYISQMRICLASYYSYNWSILGTASVDDSYIGEFRTDGKWLYKIDAPTVRKRKNAKNTVVFRYFTEEEYLKYQELLKSIQIVDREYMELNDYLKDFSRFVESHTSCIWTNSKDKEFYPTLYEAYMKQNEIASYLNSLKENLKNSSEYKRLQYEIFKLVYGIDVEKIVGNSYDWKMEDKEVKIWVKGYSFPYLLTNHSKIFLHQLKEFNQNQKDTKGEIINEENN